MEGIIKDIAITVSCMLIMSFALAQFLPTVIKDFRQQLKHYKNKKRIEKLLKK